MLNFTADILPARVRFGWGMDEAIAEEAERLGLKRLIVLSTRGRANDACGVAEALRARAAGTFHGAEMHTPVKVTLAAVSDAEALGADGLVTFRGGSATGLGKAIALRTGLPQISVPTTYAGSEATPILGQTEGGRKSTLRDPKVLPKVIDYDVARTMTLPVELTVTSGLNAVAHAVEALYAKDANPISEMMASAGLKAMIPALRTLAKNPSHRDARADALFGAWMCGGVLGQVGMALHHKICHTLGGLFDLDHAKTHGVVLPHATAYNAAAAGDALAPLEALIGGPAGLALHDLGVELGAPTALRDLGMPESGISEAVDNAMLNPYWNPKPQERDAIQSLVRSAWEGSPPTSAVE